jgi:predicted O-methyltransferase YrrM
VLWLKRAFDRMIGSIMRRITTHWYEWPWRDPGAALRNELQRRATIAAADFVTTRMPDALHFSNKFDLLTYAVQQAPPGLALEFGVFKGTTINHLARAAPKRHFFGFDSFEGLPEHWTGARYSPVNFDRRGKKPRVPANVSLIKGWFDATLPAFLAREMGRIGFIHIDCDIYASTKTVLELTVPRLRPGALIVFDEFFNYKGYELHEYKAFFEVTERFDLACRFIGYAGQQVAVVVDTVRAPAGRLMCESTP